ncbi:hypothetical protein IMY05_001G0253800 [Salix suchowensis]|nr:hypothetical protein IMY05_001G0253800 [Salix suchowensis]
MLPMFAASGFRFVHGLPMKKSFLFTFRGASRKFILKFSVVSCTLPESTMYFVSQFIVCSNGRSRLLLIIAGD